MLGRRRRTPRQAPALPGIPGYSQFCFIGSGGFSRVYMARQDRFARTVAVKVVTAEMSDDALRRFRREQATAGRLDGHPNVIRVYESGFTEAGQPYLTMEYHERGSLADRLRRDGPLPASEALAIGVKLACALDAAHRHGVVHRDVKPQNVLVSPFAGPVLADFGIAAADDARLNSLTGEAFSVLHVAPEVLEGLPATPSADLYSLASTLYELVAGRAPFATGDDGLLGLMRRVRTEPVPPVGRPGVPAVVSEALVGLLACAPDARPPTGVALAERLRDVQAAAGLEPTPLVVESPGSPVPVAPPVESGTPSRETPSMPPPVGPLGPPVTPTTLAPSVPSGASLPEPPDVPPPPPDEVVAATLGRRPVEWGAKPDEAAEPGRRRPGRRTIAGVAVAVAVLAAGTAWWAVDRPSGGEATGSTTTTEADADVTEDGTGLPPCPDPPANTLPDQPFSAGQPPTQLAVEVSGDGTAATLRWDDPNAGRNVYVAFVHCDAPDQDDRRVVDVVAPGEPPEATVPGLSLDFNYCFTVGVLEPDATVNAYTGPGGDSFLCLDQTTR